MIACYILAHINAGFEMCKDQKKKTIPDDIPIIWVNIV
jgi:hypothetical protein